MVHPLLLGSCAHKKKGKKTAEAAATHHEERKGPWNRVDGSTLPTSVGTKDSYSKVNTSLPFIALTFDDGPHATNTPRLLDLLKSRNVKATFYVVATNARRYPEIMRRIVAEGHEIGNHTYTHRKLTTLNDYAVDEEMRKTEQSIIRATGVKPRTMRPPYGALTQRQRGIIFSRFSYPTIMWSIDPEDWKRPGPSVVASRILTNAHNGAIILAHDLHAPTIDAMPQTFDGLLSRGYQFITVSQMLARKGRA